MAQRASWTAAWSWPARQESHPISVVWARARLSVNPGKTVLHLSANHCYQLWINGLFAGSGPHRADPKALYHDIVELEVEPGPLSLVVLVYHFRPPPSPASRSWCLADGPPGLIAELRSATGPGAAVEWEMRRSGAWSPEPGNFSRFRGPVHDIDLAQWKAEWAEAVSGESAWRKAEPIAFGTGGFYPVPIVPEIPALLEEAIRPVRVGQELAGIDPLEGVQAVRSGRPGSGIVVTPDQSGSRVSLRYGRVFCGFLELTLEGEGVVEIFFGEGEVLRLQERLRISGAQPVPYRSMEWRGGDQVVFHFRSVQKPMKLSNLRVIDVRYPFEERGCIRTSNPEWDALWRLCAATAHAGVRDHPMDCCGREQALWLEDLGIHAGAMRCCFGDLRPVRKALLQSLRNLHPKGYVPVPGPASEGYHHAGETLPWSAQALALPGLLRELLWWRPERPLLTWALPKIRALVDFFASYGDSEGVIALDPPGRQRLQSFCGWNPSPQRGAPCDLNAFFAIALREASEAARLADEESLASEWRHRADTLLCGIRNRFWSPERGLFCDGEIDGRRLESFSVTANAWCALAGAVPDGETGRWVGAVTSGVGLVPPVTPYDASLLLLAFCKTGADAAAADLLTGYFGSIVRAGQSLMPEFWQEHGGTTAGRGDGSSRCHPYGTAPAIVLSEHILGVKLQAPERPGKTRIRIEPHSLGLSHASGSVPLPSGIVRLRWHRSDSRWTVEITLPEGVEAEVALPRLGLSEQRLLVNGNLAATASAWPWSAHHFVPGKTVETPSMERLQCIIGPGSHRIETFVI